MSPANLRYLMLIGVGVSLIGVFVSGALLLQAQIQSEKRNKRLATIVAAHLRPTYIEVSAFGDTQQSTKRSIVAHIGWVFGFDPLKSALYPAQWWVVLIGLLVLARVVEASVSAFLGRWALASVPIIWILLCRNFFSYFERRRQIALLDQFPDALAMMVRAIRVGIPVMEAIRNVSRAAPTITAIGFTRLVDEVSVGVTLEDALHHLAQSTGLTEYRFFATTLTLQSQTGGTLSDTLESLGDVIRKRAALKSKGRAMTSEARSSSMVLAVLPIGTGILLWVVSPKYINVLFTDPAGQSMLGLAIIMLAAGILSIHFIIQKALS